MASIRQYFETDFSYTLRAHVVFEFHEEGIEGVLLYDFQAHTAFLACYIAKKNRSYDYFVDFLQMLQWGRTKLRPTGRITLPSTRQFYGELGFGNAQPMDIKYRLDGDPAWKHARDIRMTRRVFIYSESDLTKDEVVRLQVDGESLDHELQFRGQDYVRERARRDRPLAFICHDSRDKDDVARPIAITLQRMLCPVWYDDFSLKVGDNLRESIERGLKECRKCILVLSENFFTNSGWTRKEFDSIFTREVIEGQQIVLPVWYGVTKEEVYDYCPSLLNVKGLDWRALGEEETCRQLCQAVLYGR